MAVYAPQPPSKGVGVGCDGLDLPPGLRAQARPVTCRWCPGARASGVRSAFLTQTACTCPPHTTMQPFPIAVPTLKVVLWGQALQRNSCPAPRRPRGHLPPHRQRRSVCIRPPAPRPGLVSFITLGRSAALCGGACMNAKATAMVIAGSAGAVEAAPSGGAARECEFIVESDQRERGSQGKIGARRPDA